MQRDSAEDVIRVLRGSGLFTAEQFGTIARELAGVRRDPGAILKHLVKSGKVTRYQLKKVLLGKSDDLFVGPYVLLEKLGDGATGKVFRAARAADQVVALKVIRASLVANPVIRGRFQREAQTARALDHPNIVRLIDAGEAGGRFYIAMELVDGTDLARLVTDSGALAVPEACEYARQAALALAHAHAMGFIHRDVNPSNIVVAGERHVPGATAPAVVKVLDFGLARATYPADQSGPDLTRDYTLVGTPDYIAPEQARNSKRADARCDLYSLGCTMYFLLTGRVPFPQPGALNKIVAHRNEVPPPVQALRPEVPPDVAQLVARLMAKSPEDRIQSAAEVAAALEPYCTYPTDAAAPARETRRVARPAARKAIDPPPSSPSLQGILLFAIEDEEPTVPDPKAAPAPPQEVCAEHPIRPAGDSHVADPIPPKRERLNPPRDLPHVLWVLVALSGVGVLALMLWLVSH